MTLTHAGDRIIGESPLAYAMFLEFEASRDLHDAYKLFMAKNLSAQTSFKRFIRTAHEKNWQERINNIDAARTVEVIQATRRAGLDNSLSAEGVAAELYRTCMEEFKLHQNELQHKDLINYLRVANDIHARWEKSDEPTTAVTVNVEQNVEQSVEVDSEVLRRLGRELVEEVNNG